MPTWDVAGSSCEIPRNIALLDTNVLVALINPNDPLHGDTQAALDMGEFRWAVAQPTVIEAWNFLVGREKRPDLAYALMDWLLTPGQVILLDDAVDPIAVTHGYSKGMRIDIVDAGIINLANRISRYCDLKPAVHVATYDVRDFFRLFGHQGLQFNVYDLRDLSSTADGVS